MHFTYFPVWENCIILESIEEPLAKKASKTAESCVEMNNEEDNYDNSLSSDELNHGDELTRDEPINRKIIGKAD